MSSLARVWEYQVNTSLGAMDGGPHVTCCICLKGNLKAIPVN